MNKMAKNVNWNIVNNIKVLKWNLKLNATCFWLLIWALSFPNIHHTDHLSHTKEAAQGYRKNRGKGKISYSPFLPLSLLETIMSSWNLIFVDWSGSKHIGFARLIRLAKWFHGLKSFSWTIKLHSQSDSFYLWYINICLFSRYYKAYKH